MAKKKYSPEQIIVMLREAEEVLESKDLTQAESAKQIGVCEQTLIRWKNEYGGLRVDQAKGLKDLGKGSVW